MGPIRLAALDGTVLAKYSRLWIDNRFIERLWRSVKYEDVYLRDYRDGLDLGRGLGKWFADYNESRPHQALNDACPEEVYRNPESHGARTMK